MNPCSRFDDFRLKFKDKDTYRAVTVFLEIANHELLDQIQYDFPFNDGVPMG